MNRPNLSKLIESSPHPPPLGNALEKSELFVDEISLTIYVSSEEEKRTICRQIDEYEHVRVTKQYQPNYCKANYHKTYQFTVKPKKGGSFVFKLSNSPIDGQRDDGKRRFLRVEFNPSAVGAHRMWILRRLLCRLLSEGVVDRLRTEARVTRIDLALDFKGLQEPLYLYKTTARTSSIFHGDASATQYIGSKHSRFLLCWYDKAAERVARGVACEDKNWHRLEARIKDLRFSPAELAEKLKNPFPRVSFYSDQFLEDRFSKNERSEHLFRSSVRERGLNATFPRKAVWKKEKKRYLTWLEERGHQRHLFDPVDVWRQRNKALSVLDALWEERD
ncbi:MAG: hypothetical protein WBG92_13175 [Thiohalocapsa sp.]